MIDCHTRPLGHAPSPCVAAALDFKAVAQIVEHVPVLAPSIQFHFAHMQDMTAMNQDYMRFRTFVRMLARPGNPVSAFVDMLTAAFVNMFGTEQTDIATCEIPQLGCIGRVRSIAFKGCGHESLP